MKHLLIAFGVLGALGIAAALIAPSFVDWNRYKGEITRRVEEATGRRLSIDGPIELALLPTPRLFVADVRVAAPAGSARPELLRLKALEAHVGFAALFAGRIQIESLALIEPQLALERLADGRGNWQEPKARAATRSPEPEAVPGTGSPAFPSWLQLDRLTIENGSVEYRDAKSGKLWSVSQIAGGLNSGSPLGPFRAQGRAQFGKLPLTLDASLERLGGPRPASVGLKVGMTGGQLDFGGSVSETKEGVEFSGKLRASSANLSAALVALGWGGLATVPAVNQSMALEGNLTTGGQKIVLGGLSLRLGESEANGSLTYQLGPVSRAAATLSLARFDLEKWLPHQAAQGEKKVPETKGPSAGSAWSLAFTLPENFEATLDVALDGLLYKGGVVRQIRLGAALNKGELALTQFTAEFPGGSDVTLYGALRTPGGKPVLKGNIEASSDNLRAVLDWLKLDPKSVPAERLRRLSLSAALQLTPQQLQLSDVDASLDSTHMVGAATVLMQERPAFGASIAADRLNLDAYLPQLAVAGPAAPSASPVAPAAEAAKATPSAPVDDFLAFLGGFDANLRISLDELIYRDEPIHGIRLDGTVEGGALTLHEASVDDLVGLKGTLKGRLAGPRAEPTLELAFDLRDPELMGFLHYLGWRPSVPLAQLGAAALKGSASGALDKLALELDGTFMEGDYRLNGSLGESKAGLLYDVELTTRQPHLERLARLFSTNLGNEELGTLELSGHVSGDETKLTVDGLESRSPLLDAEGDFSIAGFPHRHTLTADLSLGSSRLAALLSLAGAPAPAGLDRLGHATASVKLSGDREGYALDGKLALANGTLAVVGKSSRGAAGVPSFALSLDAEEPELATLLAALLPFYRPAEARLGAFELHAKAAGTRERFALSDIRAKLGPVELKGTAAAALAGARPDVTLKLEAGAIALDPFLPAAQAAATPPKRARGQASVAAARWPTTPIALAWLRPIDAEIDLSAASLDYAQYHLEGVALAATLKDAVLTLGSLSGKLDGGDLKLAGSLAAEPEPKASLSLRLEGAKLGEAGLKLGEVKLTQGTLAATAELAAGGASELALARGLDGSGSLEMEGGAIHGLDLASANARLAAGGRVDLFTLLRAATSGGETKLKHLHGTFLAKDGVIETKDLTLEAEGASGRGEGRINLPDWYLEFACGFTFAAASEAPPFYVRLRGAPDAPRKFLDSNAFQQWIIKREASSPAKPTRKSPPAPADAQSESIINQLLKEPQKAP